MTGVMVLKVSKILDKHTLIASGKFDYLSEGTTMLVLGEGGTMPDGSPIVIPKTEVVIASVAPTYVVLEHEGETIEKEVEVPRFPGLEVWSTRREKIKVQVREGLNVSEHALSGNPGSRPIQIGDNVIQKSDYSEYVKERTLKPEQSAT